MQILLLQRNEEAKKMEDWCITCRLHSKCKGKLSSNCKRFKMHEYDKKSRKLNEYFVIKIIKNRKPINKIKGEQ